MPNPIPEGFHSVTPYLSIRGAAEAIDFYQRAFGARERFRMPGPGGQGIGHAEIVIGNSILMLSDESPECGSLSPASLNGTTVAFAIYVEDADAVFQQAVAAGAKVLEPMADKFWGDRSGTVQDPYGHKWSLMTHTEDLTDAEIAQRLAALMQK